MKLKIRFFLCAAVSIAFINCGLRDLNMNYQYIDQNNNRFIISSEDISYFPTEPSESSSGDYDGGDEMNLKITEEEFKEISKLADSILNSSETHTGVREKRTSILKINKGSKTVRKILKPSEVRSDFELVLRKALH